MAEITRTAMFGKLNSLCYRAMEAAATACKLRGNPYVELAHWVEQIFQLQDSDLHKIARHYEVNPSRLAKDMTASLESLPRGATSISDISLHLMEAVEEAWKYATLLYGASHIRSGHVVVGILTVCCI